MKKGNRFFLLMLVLLSILNNRSLKAQDFSIFGVSDLKRIFSDGYNLPLRQDTIKLYGIRGEIISGQLVVQAETGLKNVSVQLEDLTDSQAQYQIPKTYISWNFVGIVPIETNAPNQPDHYLVRKAPARFPDYLMDERYLDMDKGTFQAIWLTLKIPRTAKAGDYKGNVFVSCKQGIQSFPVRLIVYPLSMPQERHLKVAEWANYGNIEKYHGISEKYSGPWLDMLRIYAENQVNHRQNVFQVPMNEIRISQLEDGSLDFDFSYFDTIAQVFWETGKMDYLETGELARFGEKGWSDTEIRLQDFSVYSMAQKEAIILGGEVVIPLLLPVFEAHLKEKGWLDKTLFHIKDEPSIHNAVAWEKVSAYMHNYAPNLTRLDALETDYILKEEGLEVAIPKLDAFHSWFPSFKKWSDNGNELWFYTVGIYQGGELPNKTIDVPLMDNRILHWLNYRYDATGFLHWGWNQWHTESPFTEVEMHVGDGWHVYPKQGGLLNSLRWEQMRNGIQDYEYFWLLEDRIQSLKDSLGSDFQWIDPSWRGKEIAGQVVSNLKDHSQDPKVLNDAKIELIDEILQLDASPRLYIQTNPPANTSWTMHSSVAVLGWAEPGTKVIINGTEIPVRENGMFMEQFGGEQIDSTKIPWGNAIEVEARHKNGTKRIIRKFHIE